MHSFAVDYSDKSSLRLTYFSMFLLIIVFWAAYSAALISFLTSVIRVLPFDSLESFVADGTYQLAALRGTAYYDKFAVSVILCYSISICITLYYIYITICIQKGIKMSICRIREIRLQRR